MNIYFFKLASFLYLFGSIAYLVYIIFLKENLSKLALTIASIGFASHTLALITRYAEAGHTPVTNLHESLSFGLCFSRQCHLCPGLLLRCDVFDSGKTTQVEKIGGYHKEAPSFKSS